MKICRFSLGWMVWFVFGGCALTAQPGTSVVAPQITIAKPIDTTLAYPFGQFIGIKVDADAECPKITGWQESPLFVELYPYYAREPLPKELRRFCRYETKSRTAPYPTSPALIRIDPDPVVVFPAGLADDMRDQLADRFLQQVGRTGVGLPIDDLKRKVRLAFLDTFPTDEAFREIRCAGGHGDFMRRIGRALTCDRDQCMTQITTQLALPIRSLDSPASVVREKDCGGAMGSISDLATAIHRELDTWKNWTHEPHLVINLSVAWDGVLFGGLNQKLCEMPAGPQAVFEALKVARTEGALVIAAVGNDKSGPHAIDGPLLPAAWESVEVVESSCSTCSDTQEPPLVYAVGGLSANDEPIANARRPGSMPSLAAFADHATVRDGRKPTPSTYTGTSVAAAVASSVAAAVWYTRPELDAAGVVEILRRSGEKVERPDSMFGDVRRVLLCPALKAACPTCVHSCCPQRDREPLVITGRLNAGSPFETPFAAGMVEVVTPPNCMPNRIWRSLEVPVLDERAMCPARIFNDRSSEQWLNPQPGGDPCPNCVEGRPEHFAPGDPAHYLYLEIRNDWDPHLDGKLVSATLEIEGSDGATRAPTSYPLRTPAEGYHASYTATIELPARISFPPGYRAYISWTVERDEAEYSIRSPLLNAKVPFPTHP